MTMSRSLVPVLCAVVLIVPVASAQSANEDVLNACLDESRTWEERLVPCRSAADQGRAAAQYMLGKMYQSGFGVLKDDAEALKWFTLAADQGDVTTQYLVGRLYETGQGVLENKTEAVKWYILAAEQGQLGAGVKVQNYAAEGIGITEFIRAADRGDAIAQYFLAQMYDVGDPYGVPEDNAKAQTLYRMAGVESGEFSDWPYLFSLGLIELHQFADEGRAIAQYALARLYDEPLRHPPEDNTKAVKWYILAAEQGHSKAQFNLGVMYDNGEGVLEDYVQAYAWYNLSAAQGNEMASLNKDKLRKLMTRDQVQKAQELSTTLLQSIKKDRSR